jgi:hypothetical protein
MEMNVIVETQSPLPAHQPQTDDVVCPVLLILLRYAVGATV